MLAMAFPVVPRKSTTLMLAVRSQITNQHPAPSVGYKLLMLQRSSNMKFMPNRYVFPGGVSETTDFSPEWLDLIGDKSLPLKQTMLNAPFYKSHHLPRDSLPAHVGFRICAIRETFEESGILLVRPLKETDNVGSSDHYLSKILSDEDVKSWRERVHSNASLFIQLCRDLQCAPNIWSLYEWSNWITPAYNRIRRFDTMFYLSFLDSEPVMSHDGQEVTHSIWVNPEESFVLKATNKLNIAPPQFYEMSRLCRFSKFDELKTFAMSLEGVEPWEGVSFQTVDGNSVYVFPGDGMYEQVKSETHKHYENMIRTTAASELKLILPLLQVPNDHNFLKTPTSRNRIIVNMKTLTKKPEITATLKYNMPTPLIPAKL